MARADPDGEASGRISDRLKAVVAQAADPDLARSVLGTKLIALGVALLCLAGGLDYFENAEQVRQAVTGYARDAGQAGVAATVEGFGQTLERLQAAILDVLPEPIRRHLPPVALAAGLVSLVAGVGVKLRTKDRTRRGKIIRDSGRAIAAPGLLGAVAFALLSWRSYSVLRNVSTSFIGKVLDGTYSSDRVAGLAGHYAPWAWREVGGVLVLGVVFAGLWVGGLVARRRWREERPRLAASADVAARVAFWAAVLSLTYYAAITVIAVLTYGGALPKFVWSWKYTRGAFLVTLGLMAFGLGLWRSGRAVVRSVAAEEAAAADSEGKRTARATDA